MDFLKLIKRADFLAHLPWNLLAGLGEAASGAARFFFLEFTHWAESWDGHPVPPPVVKAPEESYWQRISSGKL
jgi:hypothetical protein